MIAARQGRKCFQHMPPEGCFGHGAIEEHALNVRVVREEVGKIVGYDGLMAYPAVQATFALATLEYIPQRYSG
jgi:hypothetical protein